MSSVIPKEKLSAYERWELASFGDERPPAQETQQKQAELEKQNAEMIAAQAEEARKQAYAQGFEQGRQAGLAAGRADAAQEVAKLRKVAQAFGEEVARSHETVANELLDLALDFTKALLKTSLKLRPELVLPVVAEAIHYLPSVQQPALLVLHPQDAEVVRTHMGDELGKAGWRINEDPQQARGGCRIETASNQIDASMPVRWQRLAEALGKQDDWIE